MEMKLRMKVEDARMKDIKIGSVLAIEGAACKVEPST
jgi:hypothetical protein